MERKELIVFSDSPNVAVIQVPGRQFPGSVIQGDSLAILCGLARSIHQRASVLKDEELAADADHCFSYWKIGKPTTSPS